MPWRARLSIRFSASGPGAESDRERRVLFLQVNKQNTGAIGFYAAAGFTIARGAVFDIGSGFVMDDYVMEKRLS